MNNKYKIAFVDIDWTLLDHKIHDWDYEAIEALKFAQKQGILVYIATARPYDSIYHTGLLDIFKPDGIICTNGGVVFVNDKLLYAKTYPVDVVKGLEELGDKLNLVLEFANNRSRYFTRESNDYVIEHFKSYAEVIPPVIRGKYDNVSEALIFATEEYDERIKELLPPGLKYYRYDLYGGSICYYDNDKGQAIRKVLEYLWIDKSQAIGVGDDFGDIPMFEEVGLSIAMGNGKQEARDKATYVTKSISKGGLAHAFEELGIIPYTPKKEELLKLNKIMVKNNNATHLIIKTKKDEIRYSLDLLKDSDLLDLTSLMIDDYSFINVGHLVAVVNNVIYIKSDDDIIKSPFKEEDYSIELM